MKGHAVYSQPKPISSSFRGANDLQTVLAATHSRLEKSFLDGGNALISVTEIINGLVESLNSLAGILDGKTTETTVTGLRRTVADLARLPDLAEARQVSFNRITDLCHSTQDHVVEMREIIRYLGTFAITVKITGAGIAEFAGFAEEIQERIQSGATEIDRFAEHLSGMRGQLDTARSFSEGILTEFRETVPKIAASLEKSSAELANQHRSMGAIARDVKAIALGIQSKVGTVLSALQIGDITRQRIEHVQTSFDYLEEQLARLPAGEAEAAGHFRQAILDLAHAQLQDMLTDFRQKCAAIFETISSFTADAAQILTLRDELNRSGGGEGESLLHRMQADIRQACDLSQRVQERGQQSDGLVGSVTQTAQELLAGIETIRAIKTDIHYMALNSNLRCSRLGDQGRSVNVVSGELRTFAAKLETPADAIVEDMRRVEDVTLTLVADQNGDIDHINEPLQAALTALEAVSGQMDQGLKVFFEEGQQVFTRINAAVSTLDFKDQLAAMLDNCVAQLEPHLSRGHHLNLSHPLMAELSARIFAIYTMAQERTIHQNLLPMDRAVETTSAPASNAGDDDDLIAAALF
ncbi:chemotaxis protein [Rhizobium paknamense]|uniref:Methyl-accepting chemotaxis protein n=1 Tax=Rhizobium paknamense TaxID=1206817 RepID=A0ABU0IIS9_9HYPH|nr:chemotaxis protein [Rhizobium paknamense]MDQ0457325.1 methyl-accepting chemotaxis protein [Rhizobium paknamense]